MFTCVYIFSFFLPVFSEKMRTKRKISVAKRERTFRIDFKVHYKEH